VRIIHQRKPGYSLIKQLSHFGHNKSLEIKPYAALPADKRPTLLYAGDGVSDLSAAAETDLLFAKKGHGMNIAPENILILIPY
jgi:2-hydroxy-3-keto-5-methylthiopentenyl-1-phosphate phosphatase